MLANNHSADEENSMVQIHDQIDSMDSGYKLTKDDFNDFNKLTINKNGTFCFSNKITTV